MAKGQLTAQEARRLAKVDGLHRVAPSLYLRVRGGSSLWTLRFMVEGRANEYSLGSQADLTLADAVAKASDLRARIKRGEAVEGRAAAQQAATRVAVIKTDSDTFESVALHLWGSMKPGW
ncbi:MAG: Arm DNA-binding domain-containing protein [Thiomonas sp.]